MSSWPHVCADARQVVYLFFLNRYLIPVGFIINIVAYNLQDWSISVRFIPVHNVR